MDEYYVKQKDRIERMRELAGSIEFHPPMHRQILYNWLDSVTIDWPVSRRRYYGTEVPVWYCDACGEPHVPEPGPYYQPWREDYPGERCTGCGGDKFTGETRTLDTWMDSSISPLFVAGYERDADLFGKAYPAAVRPQSKDIVRTWLYYTLLRCDLLTGMAPWREAWIMGYGLDERGLKMSKSRGNSIDPYPVIRKYGADAFRLWSASEVNHGYDFRCNEQKIDSMRKFLSKLWNISRLLSEFPVPDASARTTPAPADEWILGELDTLIKRCREGYGEYNFFIPATAVREFTWNVFAAHYVEMVKRRARRGRVRRGGGRRGRADAACCAVCHTETAGPDHTIHDRLPVEKAVLGREHPPAEAPRAAGHHHGHDGCRGGRVQLGGVEQEEGRRSLAEGSNKRGDTSASAADGCGSAGDAQHQRLRRFSGLAPLP